MNVHCGRLLNIAVNARFNQVGHANASLVEEPLHGGDGQPVNDVLPVDEAVGDDLAALHDLDAPPAVGGFQRAEDLHGADGTPLNGRQAPDA